MEGKISKIIGENGLYSFPITVPDAVFIDKDTNLSKKLKELETYGNSYIIELSRWGITKGLPSKPYKANDYITADKNVQGINRALLWASTKGFTEIKLPTGQYAVVYKTTIRMQSNIIFNLNQSTLKVIFDSDVQSPLDTRVNPSDIWNTGGGTVIFEDCANAEITNGTLIGDRYDRTFINPSERYFEGSYGVNFSRLSTYCRASHLNVSGYMGDNITFGSGSKAGLPTIFLNAGHTLAGLDKTTGLQIASITTLITNYITLPKKNTDNLFVIQGQTYTRGTALDVKTVDVFYYRADGSFIGALYNRRIYLDIDIPKDAATMRMQFQETDPTKDVQMTLHFGRMTKHNKVEYCDIHWGHRGGMTMGGSYNIIQYNNFRYNGTGINDIFLYENKPTFPDTTRYHINQEDSFGDNCKIQNNVFTGGFHGLLIGSHSTFIKENHFYNIGGNAIRIYAIDFAKIEGNFLYSGGGISLSGTSLPTATVHVTNNMIFTGADLSNPNYFCRVEGNTFVDSAVVLNNKSIGTDNTFILNRVSQVMLQSPVLSNSTFIGLKPEATGRNELRIEFPKDTKFTNCTFKNLQIYYNTIAGHTDINVANCTFNDCRIRFNNGKGAFKYENCELIDTVLQLTNDNTPESCIITVRKCKFVSTKLDYFMFVYNNPNTTKIEISDSTIEINNSIFTKLFQHNTSSASTTFIVKNNSLKYTGVTPLSIKYTSNTSNVLVGTSVMANNTLENISFSESLPTGKYLDHDPSIEAVDSPNTLDKVRVSQKFSNVAPVAGGYIGWICLNPGIPCKINWTASKDNKYFDVVTNGVNVYRCVKDGKSGSDAPSHTSGIVVANITSTNNWSASTAISVGNTTKPTTLNGYIYECTTAGTTGTTTPIWTTSGTITDGTVVWTPRVLANWEYKGNLAVFKPYGSISN